MPLRQIVPLRVPSHLRQTYVRCSARKTVIPCVVRLTSGSTVMSSATRQPSGAKLHDGTMPCDGPWPAEQVEVFDRWVDQDPQREMHGARLTGVAALGTRRFRWF